ncbi:MAG: ABC transporter permease, partial [Candidatus Rokubacteria bacterium]|nr:ABC transporter permease [Candidatus Rokubacteria bacterium]
MRQFILRRVLVTVPVLLGVSLLAFAIMHVVPGDPVRLIAGPDAPEDVVDRIRAELGLDRPLHQQYWSFLTRAVQGDLGRSLRSRAPVVDEILNRFPATLELTTVSMLIAVAVGVPLGLVSAVRRATWVDYTAMGVSLSTLSMPVFWFAIVAIWIFSLNLGWFPVSGRGGPVWEWDGLRHVALPAITLA